MPSSEAKAGDVGVGVGSGVFAGPGVEARRPRPGGGDGEGLGLGVGGTGFSVTFGAGVGVGIGKICARAPVPPANATAKAAALAKPSETRLRERAVCFKIPLNRNRSVQKANVGGSPPVPSALVSRRKRAGAERRNAAGMDDHAFGFRTRALHAGTPPDPTTGARAMPIYLSTSFVFDSTEHAAELFALRTYGNIYSRIGNPTVAAFEERMASLEGGLGAVATSSGLAAQLTTILGVAQAGDHVVAGASLYGGTITQFTVTLKRMGIECTLVG